MTAEMLKKGAECIFLRNNECTIYKHRPSACVNFPYGKVEFNCPGILEKENHKDKAGEQILSKKRFQQEIKMFEQRETISALIQTAKTMADMHKLYDLIKEEEMNINESNTKQ